MLARQILVASFLFGSLAAGAQAADLPVKANGPAYLPVQVQNWTGFYAGIYGGYHVGDITQSGCVGLCAVNPKLEGGIFGFQFGYDYQFSNNVVVGIFAQLPVVRPTTTINIGGPGLDFHVKPTFATSVAGRVGYAYGRWLPYVFAGAEFARVEVHSDVTGLTPSTNYTGAMVGAGVEFAVLRNFSVDLRYTYTDLPKRVYDFGGGAENYGETASNFTIGANYRF